jgi:hypothetical protein
MTTNAKVFEWLMGQDTGQSSKAIVAFMNGVRDPKLLPYPQDPDDLGRCIRLLNLVPEYRQRLPEMKEASPQWAKLIEKWDVLEAMFLAEAPTLRAPTTYHLMRDLLDSIPWLPPLAQIGDRVMVIQGGSIGQVTEIEWVKRDYGDVKLWGWSYTVEGDGFVKEGLHREAFDTIKEERA